MALSCEARRNVKVLLVLYDGKQHAVDVPGLLGTTENELGLRKWLEDQGHTLVTTSDKDGDESRFDKELVDSEVIITTPYVLPGMISRMDAILQSALQIPSCVSNCRAPRESQEAQDCHYSRHRL